MADLANLRISVDSRDVTAASRSLDNMAGAAAGAEGSIRDVGATASRTSVAINGMNSVIAQGAQAQAAAANAMRAVGQTGQLASHQITNLAFQFQDLGVQIASGANPLTAFVQQGSQISGIMMQSGMSAKQFGIALLSLVGILKTTSNAELDAAAATTAATASRFRALNAQAVEAVVAAEAEIALANAQRVNATTATAAQAATDRLAAAQARLAAAQVEASATSSVFATAQTQASSASTAAGAATRVAFGPAAAVIAGLAVAVGGVTAALSFLSNEFNKSGEVEAYAKSIGLTSEQIEKAGGASITTMDTIKGLWTTISEGLNLGAVFDTLGRWFRKVGEYAVEAGKITYAAFAGTFNAIKIIFSNLPAVLGDLFVQAVNKSITAVNWLIQKIVDGINSLAGETLISPIKFAQMANDNAGAAQKAGQAIGKAYTDAYTDAGAFLDRWNANSAKAAKERLDEVRKEKKARAEKESAEAKELENRIKQSEDYIKSLEKETARIGKTAIEIKKIEVAAAAAAAPTKELADRIKEAGEAWEKATREQAAKDFQRNIIKPLQDELKLVGLTGEARAIRVVELEEEAFKAKALADGLADVNGAWEQYKNAKMEIIKAESAIERERKEAEKLKQTLNDLVGLMDDLFGGAGSILVGLGREIRISAPEFEKNIKSAFESLPKELKESLKSVFDAFLADLPGVMANARIGMAVGGGAGGAIGGAIGGALGKELLGGALSNIGTKIAGEAFGKALGNLAGPLGAIAGGLLGGLVSGLLKKTPRASATLTQVAGGAMSKTITGSNSQLKGIADKLAGGLLSGLGNIAEQLGGTLGGAVSLSIGMRKKSFVVDPTGRGRTKGAGVMNFGEDQAAAVAYATQLAIQQGIITGISAGAQALIKAGGDLNAQVQKALKFDEVFRDLKRETDPLGASLDELSREMDKLKSIFAEAGASTEQYAQLEELFAIRRAKAIFEAGKPARELEIQLMEAQGNTAGALAARRQLELESMEEGLRALQLQVWAAEDAAQAARELADAQEQAAQEAEAAARAAADLERDRRFLEIDLMEALGNSSEALAARRELELAAMDESLRGLQEQIYAAIDARAASEAAAEATRLAAAEEAKAVEAAAKLAADRRELEVQLLEAQGRAIEALAARRAMELDATDASLRALREQIYIAQDRAEADAAAARAAEEAAAAEARAADEAARAMREYMETLESVTKTVTDEINRLRGINASSTSALLKAQFATLTAQARNGNLEALGKLPELSRSIEEATIGTATSALEVARIRAWLSASLSETLAAQSASNAEINTTGAGMIFDGNQTTTAQSTAQTAESLSNMRGEMYNALYQIAKNTGKSYELMDRWDGDGLPDIREDAGDYY